MATLEQLSAALVKADAAGDSEAARAFAGEIRKMKSPQTSVMQDIKQNVGNVAAGLVRGAGSIGATLLAPKDIISDAIDGKGLSLESNRQRRADMDAALSTMGAETDSYGYKGGKLVGEILGTAGAGGAIANTLTKVAPSLATAAPGVINAIRTGGMTTGAPVQAGAVNLAKNLLVRGAGGAVTGGLSAGLTNPEDALGGAIIGGAAPTILKAAGAAGSSLGRLIKGPQQTAETLAGVQAARNAGYVIPPTQANPTLTNRLLEGFSGKITTAQNASAKNAEVTNKLASTALGLAPDAKITPDVLNDVRRAAGQAYEAVSSTGMITPKPAYESALDKITAPFKQSAAGFPNAKPNALIAEIESLKSPSFDASSAVSKISELRESASAAYASGDKQTGKALKAASDALENTIDQHLQEIGAPADLLNGFRNARTLIAKTYTVEKALNPTTGTVNAQKLASELKKGKPLSGELRKAAEFAQQFPKAAQPLEAMGSLPGTSPLDWIPAGAVGAATANPLMLAGVAARPAARKLALSDLVQNRLVQKQGGNALSNLLAGDAAQQAIYRSAPIALGQR